MAFMHEYGYQPGWFANNRIIRADRVCIGNGFGTGHAGFLIGGRQNAQWFFQLCQINTFQRFGNKNEEAFHIDGAKAINTVTFLRQLERVFLPAPGIERNSIGVSGKEQSAITTANGGDQIEFSLNTRYRSDIDLHT